MSYHYWCQCRTCGDAFNSSDYGRAVDWSHGHEEAYEEHIVELDDVESGDD